MRKIYSSRKLWQNLQWLQNGSRNVEAQQHVLEQRILRYDELVHEKNPILPPRD